MSFGTYQPFNPSANTGQGNLANSIGNAMGQEYGNGLFGQNAQGPLASLTRQIPSMAINSVASLPGTTQPQVQPPLTPQQNVAQSRQGGGILKMRQQPGQPPVQQPGGKSGGGGPFFGGGGGKYTTGGPAIQTMPSLTPPDDDFQNQVDFGQRVVAW